MGIINHIRRHYEVKMQQTEHAINNRTMHRDMLMKHHNNIKRQIIHIACQCCLASARDKVLQDFILSLNDNDKVIRLKTNSTDYLSPAQQDEQHKYRKVQVIKKNAQVQTNIDYKTRACSASSTDLNTLNVLDLGCGKGGDILKWHHERVLHYTGVDISESSIAHAKSRVKTTLDKTYNKRSRGYQSMRFTFNVQDIICYLEEIGTNIMYDVISLQFVIHYIVDDITQLSKLFALCKTHLTPGGVLLGTIVNSDRATELFKRTRSDYFGFIPIINQSKQSDETGYAYEFFLRNCVDHCIEHLVPWTQLVTCASGEGFAVDYRLSFDTFEEEENELHEEQRILSRCYDAFQLRHSETRVEKEGSDEIHNHSPVRLLQ